MFLSSLAFITWTLYTSQLSCKSVHFLQRGPIDGLHQQSSESVHLSKQATLTSDLKQASLTDLHAVVLVGKANVCMSDELIVVYQVLRCG